MPKSSKTTEGKRKGSYQSFPDELGGFQAAQEITGALRWAGYTLDSIAAVLMRRAQTVETGKGIQFNKNRVVSHLHRHFPGLNHKPTVHRHVPNEAAVDAVLRMFRASSSPGRKPLELEEAKSEVEKAEEKRTEKKELPPPQETTITSPKPPRYIPPRGQRAKPSEVPTEVEPWMCRWPAQDGGRYGLHVCGRTVQPGHEYPHKLPYCAEHLTMALTQKKSNK